jgi:hypothetical protein
MLKSFGVGAAGVIALLAMSGCSSNHAVTAKSSSAAAGASAPAAKPAAGTAELVVGAEHQALHIQSCAAALGGRLTLVAGVFQPSSTLVVAHVDQEISGSSLILTSMQADKSYDTYSLAAIKGNLVTGNFEGSSISLKGMATEQTYTASGSPTGVPKQAPVSMGATCSSIQPLASTPAPVPAATGPTSVVPKQTARTPQPTAKSSRSSSN